MAPALPASPSGEPAGGRVAVVSGATCGLGLRTVRALAGAGMRVVLGTRSVVRGQAAVGSLGDLADRVAVRQLDVTDEASVMRLAGWLHERLGRCDVLVNNAAVLADDDHLAATVDLDTVRRTLETNLLGTWRLTRMVLPLMRLHRYGRIVNVSSDLASLASMGRGLPAYRISKSAVNGLTRVLAEELAGDGILVNAWCPAPVHLPVDGQPTVSILSVAADTPVWLATLSDHGPTGGFYRGRVRTDW